MSQGKFIVIDGTDGSGKATQVGLLEERLKKEGNGVLVIDYPRYDDDSSFFVRQYLNGKYGSAMDVGAKKASIFYALDRYDHKKETEDALKEGKIVLANRYVSANMGHQGGKMKDKEERRKFIDWLYKLEYELFGIPKPDLNLILHVDPKIGQKLVDEKGRRRYVGGVVKRDLHEDDLEHLRDAEAAYLDIATLPGFVLLECCKNGEIMTREEIHNMIWDKVSELI